jgi:hypothetical protein
VLDRFVAVAAAVAAVEEDWFLHCK